MCGGKGIMTRMRVKRSDFILGLCVGTYVFLFLQLFVYSVQNDTQNDGIIRSINEKLRTEEQGNVSAKHLRDYNMSWSGQKRNNSIDYKNDLKVMFDILKDNSEAKSSCKMLMDENVVLRALEFGQYPWTIFQSHLSATHASVTNKTEKSVPTYQKTKPKSCQSLGYSDRKIPTTALASFPGSGNTWVRHLLQQATGEIHV